MSGQSGIFIFGNDDLKRSDALIVVSDGEVEQFEVIVELFDVLFVVAYEIAHVAADGGDGVEAEGHTVERLHKAIRIAVPVFEKVYKSVRAGVSSAFWEGCPKRRIGVAIKCLEFLVGLFLRVVHLGETVDIVAFDLDKFLVLDLFEYLRGLIDVGVGVVVLVGIVSWGGGGFGGLVLLGWVRGSGGREGVLVLQIVIRVTFNRRSVRVFGVFFACHWRSVRTEQIHGVGIIDRLLMHPRMKLRVFVP